MNRMKGKTAFLLVLGMLSGIGCQDREIKTYRVAKDDATSSSHADHDHPHADEIPAAPTPPTVHYDVPAGWQEQKPDRMRAASFQIVGENGKLAEVSVTPLPGAQDIENQAVNLWRQELGLEPLSASQFEEQRQKVPVDGGSGNLYEMVSAATKGSEQPVTRQYGVVYSQGEVLWFIKMKGEDALVTAQKPAFLSFLKSLHFTAPTALASAPVSTNSKEIPANSDLPKWQAPANWHAQTPGPMLLASYGIDAEGGHANVTISQLPGDAGGESANINRWRGQLGLRPATEADLAQTVTSMEIDGKKAYVVDIKGTNVRTGNQARMVAVGVPRPDGTWFYKLTGDESTVEKEKGAFLKFIQSAY